MSTPTGPVGSAGSLGVARLASLGVAPAHLGMPAEVVEALGALQAQDYASALWAVGLRAPGSVRADVEAALNAGAIVRTWPMRGTLHLVPGADARWMCTLLNAPVHRAARRRWEQLGLTETDFGTAAEALQAALGEPGTGGRLTRPEAFEVLRRAGIDPVGQRGYHVVSRLAQDGLLGQVAQTGAQQTFALLDDVAAQRTLGREEAMAILAARYVRGHAPTTDRDLAWWTGQNLGWAREALALAGVDPGEVAVPSPTPEPGRLHLLPGFDEYLLGYADRSHAGPPEALDAVVPGRNGIFLPTIVVDGRIVGTWRRLTRARGLSVIPTWLEQPAPAWVSSLAEATTDYVRFVSGGPTSGGAPRT